MIDFLSTSSMAIMGFSRKLLLECTVLVDILWLLLLWKAFTQLRPFKRSCHLSSETPFQLNIFSEGYSLGELTNIISAITLYKRICTLKKLWVKFICKIWWLFFCFLFVCFFIVSITIAYYLCIWQCTN